MNENYAAFFENDKNTVELRHTFFKKIDDFEDSDREEFINTFHDLFAKMQSEEIAFALGKT